MKKFIQTLILVLVMSCVLTGCNKTSKDINEGKISIVTTIFPEYDWTKNVLGDLKDNYNLTMLLDTGVDLHSYQPTAEDILKISNCDMFIYVGGESDEWVEDALKEVVNKDMIVINLLDILGDKAKEEELVEGMQGEDEEENEEDEEEIEYDEHVWLSLKNAKLFVDEITKAICLLDENNSEIYKSNSENYIFKLNELDDKYEQMITDNKNDTLVFGDRFPFRYLVDDYNLKYYAAFIGCSAETEASFETITFLTNKLDELNINAIFALEGSDKKIAQTIVNNTKDKNQKILTLDSMQSVTSKDVLNGANYISIMENNFNVLSEALK